LAFIAIYFRSNKYCAGRRMTIDDVISRQQFWVLYLVSFLYSLTRNVPRKSGSVVFVRALKIWSCGKVYGILTFPENLVEWCVHVLERKTTSLSHRKAVKSIGEVHRSFCNATKNFGDNSIICWRKSSTGRDSNDSRSGETSRGRCEHLSRRTVGDIGESSKAVTWADRVAGRGVTKGSSESMSSLILMNPVDSKN
jgi:hypothetical protein